MMNKNVTIILNYLDLLFPNAKCELKYELDYELLIAIVLSAQAKDAVVNQVTPLLFKKYSSIKLISEASIEELEKIIKPVGTYHLKSRYIKNICQKLVKDGYQTIPNNWQYLESLPGVGHKTAGLFLANINGIPAFPVDTHITRVAKRLKLVNAHDNTKQIETTLKQIILKKRWIKTHHQLVLFGRYYCKAKKPLCSSCKLMPLCYFYQITNKNR